MSDGHLRHRLTVGFKSIAPLLPVFGVSEVTFDLSNVLLGKCPETHPGRILLARLVSRCSRIASLKSELPHLLGFIPRFGEAYIQHGAKPHLEALAVHSSDKDP